MNSAMDQAGTHSTPHADMIKYDVGTAYEHQYKLLVHKSRFIIIKSIILLQKWDGTSWFPKTIATYKPKRHD